MITKKIRLLSFALIFSAALNIGLIATLGYFMAEKSGHVSQWIGKREELKSNGQIFSSMARLSFRELVSFLTNRELVEEGYSKRDLALAALVGYHHFNLEKAICAKPTQVRKWIFSKDQTIDVFPALTEEQFEAIIRFAYQEKWPLTTRGLFSVLQSQKSLKDESLEQAFSLTPEFSAIQLFFQKTKAPQPSHVLIDLLVSGSWDLFEKFFKEQSQAPQFSEERRRNFLLNYLVFHSNCAAHLLLKTDFSYALKRFDDKQILDLLSLLKKQSEEGACFCMELLRSPRSDAIWQAAAFTLYSYAGEMPPLPIDPETVLARFSPEKKQTPPVAIAAEILVSPSRFHVVKEGESLWKISRQYKIKVDEIVQMNQLESNSLFPGMTLKLPQGTGSEPPR